ncbi:SDR family NAD(P)-dependent oxidoreductase [Actinomycetospora corticicola]|uniref:NAD(P)-dependent dehydrogenase (Short-subunit alcohol dehydrogenase family) n=1 Tax=Actinomycetospora corticicola TaxID=663602 RepID=A0A7Y9J6G4_9PSEU|nr:SDR family NAD(P)-dependent oxidoreductase [Actinomycetospora corticicola]NYD37225.1 NAD(P)-dependent dehydrogenase (short-subunit alcohol dehydrogenase family) [Actinomycetospora corticicola]
MELRGATALVTGTNRGIGRHFALELLARGARVYATARRPELVDVPGADVLRLDITDPASVAAAAEAAGDVDLLVNNAASTAGGNLVTGDLDAIRTTMDSNYYGTLAMIRAFAPILARNGGGAVLNVLSGVAWQTVDGNTAYAAAKSAQWGLTNGVRVELAGQGTLVAALVPGLVATTTMKEFARDAGLDLGAEAMTEPADLVRIALDGLEAGEIEILDGLAVVAKRSLSGPPRALELPTAS